MNDGAHRTFQVMIGAVAAVAVGYMVVGYLHGRPVEQPLTCEVVQARADAAAEAAQMKVAALEDRLKEAERRGSQYIDEQCKPRAAEIVVERDTCIKDLARAQAEAADCRVAAGAAADAAGRKYAAAVEQCKQAVAAVVATQQAAGAK